MTIKISVALATFNGERYLRQQLESIAAQSCPPDELIACDDQSTDDSYRILQEFASSAKFAVHVYLNDQRLGVTRNFEKAIRICAGDVIALSDQDDIWNREKLELFENVFASSDAGLVFTDAELVDAALKSDSRSLWQAVGFNSKRQKLAAHGRTLEVLLQSNVVSGATMAFRAGFRDAVLPIPVDEGLLHDGWIALIIAAMAEIRFISEPLIKYRQHRAQTIGAPKRATIKNLIPLHKTDPVYYLEQANRFQRVHDRLAANEARLPDPRVMTTLSKKIVHLRARGGMPDLRRRRLPIVLSETLNHHYHQYSNGWFSAAKDLLV